MKKYLVTLILSSILWPALLHAQVTVVTGTTAATLANKLIGSGISIMNATLTCPSSAYGTFSGSTSLSFDSGIVLTNGLASALSGGYGAFGPQSNFASTNLGTAGDAQLTALCGYPTYDACILEFDFKPTGDTVKFNYVFGSEEYGCCICTSVNDVFGFFISGPGYSTPYNMARVPGTSIPVCINSVNCSSGSACTAMGSGSPFCTYYVNNSSGTSITYYGMTVTMTAMAAVTPCDTYHLKLGIADASDHIYDSGVFLKAGSFNSTGTHLLPVGLDPADTTVGAQFTARGCAPGQFIFTRASAGPSPLTVHFNIGGTAINGYDYTMIADSITIPAYAATDTLFIYPLTVTPAGPKTVKLGLLSTYSYACGGSSGVTDSAQLWIYDSLSAITGPSSVCLGATITLADAMSGGTWTSGATSIATVGSTTGLVTGITTGVSLISYGYTSTCFKTKPVTVNPLPAAITGPSSVCIGSAVTLGCTPAGGVWSCTNPLATAASSSGLVTGIAGGLDTVIYVLPTGCKSTKQVTVNTLPVAIAGVPVVCAGSFVYLTDPAPGGSWSSASTGIATIGSLTGLVTGISPGTSLIRYTIATGCFISVTVTVNAAPLPITGISSVCVGSTGMLADATPGGIWSSGAPGLATVGSLTGLVSGVSVGSPYITYTLPDGCYVTNMVAVTPTPGPVTGVPVVCAGALTYLYDAGGGTWTSGSTSVATADPGTGIITGVSAGVATISYTISSGCFVTAVVTVSPGPLPITGGLGLCLGTADTLADATPGGSWTSSDYAIAYIDPGTGAMTGMALGYAMITYTLSSGCFATALATINPAPTAITGIAGVCTGGSNTLFNGTPGGTWTSASTGVATIIATTGVYTGFTPGTSVITYSMGAGCTASFPINVYPYPLPITGPAHVCPGATITLTDPIAGGVWSSTTTGVATIGTGTGVLTGVTSGSATISYSFGFGVTCAVSRVVTVDTVPASIGGTLRACPGTTTSLTCTSSGGTWTSGTLAVATIGSLTGMVSGIATGTTTITYTLPTGCFTTAVVTINPLPAAIAGPSLVCIGATITLADPTTGGSWSKNNANVNVGLVTGSVTGLAIGTSIITYTLPSGCYITKTVTINSTPGTITGTLNVCVGATSVLSDPATGGAWTSTTPTVATIGSASGMVTGVTAGLSVITYSLGAGCIAMATVTVNALPDVITGPVSVCAGGSTITLADVTAGGSWSTAASTVTVGTSTGVVTGVSAGTAIVTYTAPGGCFRNTTVTVNPLPAAISGPSALCVGASITLTDATTGGTWASATTSVATIGSATGAITGLTTGTTAITYTLPTGCRTITTETVSTAPGPVTGSAAVCVGATAALGNTVPGGTWTSSTGNVTIGSLSGMVTGVTAGTTVISYSLGSGCMVTRTESVTAAPAAISGAGSLCSGTTTTWTDVTPGGTWTSGATSVATIGATSGVVSGLAGGIAGITYTVGASGCFATKSITVNATPTAISGPASVCTGFTVTEADTVTGGIWSTLGTALTIGTATGVVTGVAVGPATITYSMGGCFITRAISVIAAAPVTGAYALCVSATTVLADASPGGTWSGGAPGIATVGSLTGIVTGVASGIATISYTLPSGCIATKTITVSSGPAPIAGTLNVCIGNTTALSDVTGGGAWTSGSTSVATVIPATGIVTGIIAGNATITYSLGTGCLITAVVTVNPLPSAIAGPAIVCTGSTAALTDATTGGTWGSSSTAIAAIGTATGIVSGVTTGTVTITYTAHTGCVAMRTETVSAGPAAITGPLTVCVGTSATLSDITGGGAWTSSNTLIATIGSGTGIVTGINSGTATITYSIGSGCLITRGITVNPAPPSITGVNHICVGGATTLSIATTGGSWSTGNPAIATVGSSTGIVTGIAGGAVPISYSLTAGCVVTYSVTVTAVPPFTGLTTKCAWGDTLTIHDSNTTGAYSSTVATVLNLGGGAGLVTTFAPGTSTVTYTLPSGCTVTESFTVNPLPGLITGTTNICIGITSTLFNSSPGGLWASGNPAIATAGSSTGFITGISAGTTYVTYTLPTGCKTDTLIHVNPNPTMIIGYPTMVVGTTGLYTNSTPAGLWTSALTTLATIGATTGIAHALAPGIAILTYTITTTGCLTTKSITINPLTGVSPKQR